MSSSSGSLPRTLNRRIFSFVAPSESVHWSYNTRNRNLVATVQHHHWFQQGVLLETLEKGVTYPVLHFMDVPPNQLTNGPLLAPSDLGANYTLQQGIYSEIKQFCPYPEKPSPSRTNKSRAFIVIGFKTLERTFNEVLEDMWKDWTGARSIYLNLPDELGLMQLSLYRRIHPQDLNLFMYILLVQCENVTKRNTLTLLDYIQRLRIEKMIGFMSAYSHAMSTYSALSNGFRDIEPEEFNPNVDI